MPQFHFPLAGVLRQRLHAEEQRQREMALLQQQMRHSEDALRLLDQSMQASIEDVRQNRLVGRLDLAFLAAHRRFMADVQRRGTAMAQKMALLQRDVDRARANLAEAAKQRKILEKLEEKQKARWQLEQSRKESAELGEVNTRLTAWRAMRENDSSEEKSGNASIAE